MAFVLCLALYRLRPDLSLPTLLLYSTRLDGTEHECESHKYDCSLHVGMVVLNAFDDDIRQRTRRPSSLTEGQGAMKSSDVCAASLSFFFEIFLVVAADGNQSG